LEPSGDGRHLLVDDRERDSLGEFSDDGFLDRVRTEGLRELSRET
jgi:hypothetical protein